jgi:hypothetical protein
MHIYWSIFLVKKLFLSSKYRKGKVDYDLKSLKDNIKEKGGN